MYKERDFEDRRHLVLTNGALSYLLNRYRDEMIRTDNEKRWETKIASCRHCGSYNACEYCKDR